MGYIKAPPYDHDHENEVQLFAETNHRNRPVRFGIKTDDRRRHVYVIGKSGMGKSVLLENMFLSDIHAGHGCCYIDPHGDTADRFLDYIPPHRINDVVYFSPADMEYPIGFNILESVDPDKKHLVAGGLMSVFKKIWPDVWSARMEYILINTILALLDVPGATLLGINRLYVDEDYRKRVISLIQDPVVKTFWVKEFAAFTEKYRTEAVAPVQNKVGQFLSSSIVRNIVAQSKSTIDFREIMDSRKILILNLSKGLIGESNMALLGNMIITRLQLAAMERVNMPEKERQDFFLYVDEFQNFATESFASILSEARKYRLGLVVAHQYVEQLSEEVKAAVFGNVGTMISFRVGGPDAVELEKEFAPTYMQEDLIGLTKYNIYLRLLIDGVASTPFSAKTLPPISAQFPNREKVVRVSRERYATPKDSVERNVIKWSGFGTSDAGGKIATEEEQEQAEDQMTPEEEKIEERIKELQASSPYVGEMAKPADGGGFGGKKKPAADKPTFDVPCSVCNAPQKLTFEPDWSKPWFCKDHLEMRNTPAARKLPTLAQLTGHEVQPRKAAVAGADGASSIAPAAPSAPPREVVKVTAFAKPAAPVNRPVVVKAGEGELPQAPKEPSVEKIKVEALRPAQERRPVPPPLSATAKPRLVISADGDMSSDAEELRAAVIKPAKEKEEEVPAPQSVPEPPPMPQPAKHEAPVTQPPSVQKPAPEQRQQSPKQAQDRQNQQPRPQQGQPNRRDDRREQRPLLPREARQPVERPQPMRNGAPPLGVGKIRIVRDESPTPPLANPIVERELPAPAPRPALPPNPPAPAPASEVAPVPAPIIRPVVAPKHDSLPPPVPPPPSTDSQGGWQPGQVVKF